MRHSLRLCPAALICSVSALSHAAVPLTHRLQKPSWSDATMSSCATCSWVALWWHVAHCRKLCWTDFQSSVRPWVWSSIHYNTKTCLQSSETSHWHCWIGSLCSRATWPNHHIYHHCDISRKLQCDWCSTAEVLRSFYSAGNKRHKLKHWLSSAQCFPVLWFLTSTCVSGCSTTTHQPWLFTSTSQSNDGLQRVISWWGVFSLLFQDISQLGLHCGFSVKNNICYFIYHSVL